MYSVRDENEMGNMTLDRVRPYAADDAVWLRAGASEAVQKDQTRRDREGGKAQELSAGSQVVTFRLVCQRC